MSLAEPDNNGRNRLNGCATVGSLKLARADTSKGSQRDRNFYAVRNSRRMPYAQSCPVTSHPAKPA